MLKQLGALQSYLNLPNVIWLKILANFNKYILLSSLIISKMIAALPFPLIS